MWFLSSSFWRQQPGLKFEANLASNNGFEASLGCIAKSCMREKEKEEKEREMARRGGREEGEEGKEGGKKEGDAAGRHSELETMV